MAVEHVVRRLAEPAAALRTRRRSVQREREVGAPADRRRSPLTSLPAPSAATATTVFAPALALALVLAALSLPARRAPLRQRAEPRSAGSSTARGSEPEATSAERWRRRSPEGHAQHVASSCSAKTGAPPAGGSSVAKESCSSGEHAATEGGRR